MAFPWDKLFDVGTTLVGALLAKSSTDKATKATTKAADTAAATVNQQYQQSRADIEPWRISGVNALNILNMLNTPGAANPEVVGAMLTSLPGFQFAEKELRKGIERRHAATGNRNSGRGIKEAVRWMNEYLYQPAYRNWTNDLMTLAGYGREGNQLAASLGANAANTLAGLQTGAGQARADQALATGAILANAANQLKNTFAPEDPITAYYRSLTTR